MSKKKTYSSQSIGHYNQDYNLVSHATYIVCVLILYMSGGTYSLKTIPDDRETFDGNFIYSQPVWQKSALVGDAWPRAWEPRPHL